MKTVKLEGRTVRERLEALAEHYGVGKEELRTMSFLEFAARVAAARARGGAA